MKIDAHLHFWKYDPLVYRWMTHEMGTLRRDFLPEHVEPLLKRNGIDGCIAVQARHDLSETAWLLELSDTHDFIRAVVGWVDLRMPDALRRLEYFARHPKFRGVRHIVQDEPDDLFMLRKDFQRGIGFLGRLGLTYDLLVYPVHLPVATELVDAFPNQSFVLDHMAKPYIKEKIISPWREQISDLAKRPNVMCKLSGIFTEAHWNDWQSEDFIPYIDILMETFGPDRVMIGSDWPVCTLAGTYDTVMSVLLTYLDGLSPDEKARITGGNARDFYGIADAMGDDDE